MGVVHDASMAEAVATKTVLCIDDSEGHLKILELSLAAHHYRVELAHNGHDALTMLQSLTPDLIIVDVDMPFLDGLGFTARVRRLQRFDAVPILVMTAVDREDLLPRVAEAGADAILKKPVQGKNLGRIVADVMRQGRNAEPVELRRGQLHVDG